MSFHPRLHFLIYDQGSLASNKAQWIRFKGLEGGYIGVLNVYASNVVGVRYEVLRLLLMHCR